MKIKKIINDIHTSKREKNLCMIFIFDLFVTSVRL